MTALGAWRLLLLAWAAFLMLVGPAHAQTTERPATTTARALAVACGPGHGYLAPIVERESRRQLLHPVLVVALMRVESHCRRDAKSHKGARGYLQLLGVARGGYRGAELLEPDTNIRLGCRWLASMSTWCGSLRRGLGAFNTGKCDRGAGFARRVLAREAWIWGEMRKRKEPRT